MLLLKKSKLFIFLCSFSICTDDDVSDDTSLAIGATAAAISATQDVQKEMADFTRSQLVRTMGDGRMSVSNCSKNVVYL